MDHNREGTHIGASEGGGTTCTDSIKNCISGGFYRYGKFVGRYPVPFILLPILVCGSLGFGIIFMESERRMEASYFPMNSQSLKDREKTSQLFPYINDKNYNVFAQSHAPDKVTIIFEAKNKTSGKGLLEKAAMDEINAVIVKIKQITVTVSGKIVSYDQICARQNNECVVEGFEILSHFAAPIQLGFFPFPTVANPKTGVPFDLSYYLADVTLKTGTFLTSANVFKLHFTLLNNTKEWQGKFLTFAKELKMNHSSLTYGTTYSLEEELDKGTKGDIWLFSLTFAVCITFASFVVSGGDFVSSRAVLAIAGVIAAGLGILGSLGLMSLLGVKYINIVGTMPFLIIGIGVDDMFLLMTSWSETIPETGLTVPERLGKTFALAGIGITITSATDFLAFVIGTMSDFLSVKNFSIYTAVAVLLCYICNATLFSACLSLHGRRVYSRRHCYTCKVVKTKEEYRAEGKSACFVLFCGGSIPTKEREDESIFEKIPRIILPPLFTSLVVRVVILVAFAAYVAVSIYGALNLKQGLSLEFLIPKSSYYYNFLMADKKYFPVRLPLSFIIDKEVDYSGKSGEQLGALLQNARKNSLIDPDFEQCWLNAYKNSSVYSPSQFITNLRDKFLPNRTSYQTDIAFNDKGTAIVASRCYVLAKGTDDQYTLADIMTEMRKIADSSDLPVFAFHQAFVAFEQFLAVLPATLQMVGVAIAVIFVVTVIFLPHALMVFLVTLTIVMILVGIFGFMHFWNLTLSSVTMIHLIMCVGFSVDFSAHVCSAYLMSNKITRSERAKDAITHAASPIFNGGMSTFLGVLLLIFSDSYIFVSFFKVIVMVIGFGMLHAVLFLPALLSLVGPENRHLERRQIDTGLEMIANDSKLAPVTEASGGPIWKHLEEQPVAPTLEGIGNDEKLAPVLEPSGGMEDMPQSPKLMEGRGSLV